MKFTAIISLLAVILLGSPASALAQENSCSFDLVGTWKAQLSPTEAVLYRFDAKGEVTVLSVSGTEEPRPTATAKYTVIDELDAPKSISFKATGKNRIFGSSNKTMKVVEFNDTSITCEIPGMGTTRWTRVDPDRYFLVLAARRGEFYDTSGSAFPMAIKLSGGSTTIDAFGVYLAKGERAFGAVPSDVYKNYFREAKTDSETTLRLEINSRQYERVLKVIKEWERRDRENALLYTTAKDTLDDATYLNNILVVKAAVDSLNQCSVDFNLYPLNYIEKDDWISEKYKSAYVPFYFFKELRQRNEARHIPDQKFQELVPLPNVASR